MSEDFDTLPDADKALLTALPLRIGLWMSVQDGGGGEVADELEGMAMIDTMERLAATRDYEFTAYICRQTLGSRDKWLAWSADFSDLPEECTRAISLLKRILPVADLDAFKESMFGIAASVARAFRESSRVSAAIGLPPLLGQLVHSLEDSAQGQQGTRNISPAEREALHRLAAALSFDNIPADLR